MSQCGGACRVELADSDSVNLGSNPSSPAIETDFNSPGARTAGGDAANYLITGPGWTGDVPTGMKQIKSATRYMVILGRTYADGTDQDYAAVNALQALASLTRHQHDRQATVSDPRRGYLHLFQHDGASDGRRGSSRARGSPMLARMAKIGLVPGQPFDMTKLDPATQAALKDLGKNALQRIEANKDSLGAMVNVWSLIGRKRP